MVREYLEHAEDCERLAREPAFFFQRTLWFELAAQWRSAAAETDLPPAREPLPPSRD